MDSNEKNENKTNKNKTIDKSIDFSNGVSPNKADVDAINKRAKNTEEHSRNFRRNNKEEEDERYREGKHKFNSQDGLDSKDGLGNKDGLKDKNGKSSSKDSKDKKGKSKGGLASSLLNKTDNPVSNIKGKLLKVKIKLIILGVILGIIGIILLVTFFIAAYDALFNSLSSYFGISESDTTEKEDDGLIANDKYMINPDTGEEYRTDELVEMLKSNNNCTKVTFWNKIGDFIDKIDSQFGSVCSFIRYIQNRTKKLEEKNEGLKLDRALFISSIFYGYSAQPNYSDYDNPQAVDEMISPADHYKSLIDVLSDGALKRKDLDDIMDYSIAHTSYEYFTWDVVTEKDDDGKITSATGTCKKSEMSDNKYSLQKWKIFMRFGKEAADKYDELVSMKKAYLASDDECNGKIEDDELLEKVNEVVGNSGVNGELDKSEINYARDYLKNGMPQGIELFEQHAEIDGHKKDVFKSFTYGGNNINFDYRNGFVYKRFPLFERAINDPSNNISYDDIITPKVIEGLIKLIIDKKPTINEILGLTDQDDPHKFISIGNEWSSVPGAYCPDYVSTPLNEIKVTVKDCNGQDIAETSFKDYIMGVAYGEVSNKNDDYVKSEMVAAISYALHRRSNYAKVPNIMMRSGNCDQVYCPMKIGCTGVPSNISCGGFNCTSYIPDAKGYYHPMASQQLYDKYASLYDEASQFLLVKDGTVFNAGYVSTSQNAWYKMASEGMSFTQIMQEWYGKDGAQLVQCSNLGDTSNDDDDPVDKKVGNTKTDEYPLVAGDLGKYYGYSYNEGKNGKDININPEWINENIVEIEIDYGGSKETYKVNSHAKVKFSNALLKVKDIIQNGIKISNGQTCKYTKSDFQGGQVFEETKTPSGMISEQSYGIVQNWNYNKKYNINGKTYMPYSANSTRNDYENFVKALGQEEDCRNVNYILYKYAYKPAGFTWGGTFGKNGNHDNYNGMMFRINY